MGLDRYKVFTMVACLLVFAMSTRCGGTKHDDSEDDGGYQNRDAAGAAQYDVRIVWRIGAGTQSCTDFDVRDARITLLDDADKQVDSQTLGCDLGEWTFKRLPAGYYGVKVEGIDADGFVTYQGETTNIALPGDDHYVVDLSIIYGKADIVWVFDSGYQCQAAGVDRVHVVFQSADQAFPVNQTFTCSDGIESLGQVPPGPFRVDVSGLNASDVILYEGSLENQIVKPGDRTTRIEVTMSLVATN